MPIGISLQLFNGNAPQANLSNIQALWWDVTEPKDASRPVGKSVIVTTDALGFIKLDLSNVTGLSLGDFGFLTLYKLDAGNHQDSLVFSGKVATSDVVGGVDMYYYDSGWTRPAGWLPLPVVGNNEQKVVGLYQVLPNSSFIAVTCAGACTVDWGDGTVENFASGVQAQRLYDYTNAAFNGTEITVNNLTFKQAIVTITPQAGQNLTSINFEVRHTLTSNTYSTGWLDLLVSAPSLSVLTVSSSTATVTHRLLEQFQLISSNAVTNFLGTFSGCSSLQSTPLLNTGSGTNFSDMFVGCVSLQTIPLLNTANGLDFGYMFNSCSSLQSIPLLNTAAGTSFSSMFDGCWALQTIPLLDTASGTDFNYMFNACFALERVPLLNTAAGTNFTGMFSDCGLLQSIPLLNTANGVYFDYMFDGCSALQTIPLLNTANGVDFDFMFDSCRALQSIPLLNTAAGTSFISMFGFCRALQSIPPINTAAGTSFTSMFNTCVSLSNAACAGTKLSISYANCKLSAEALNEIYANLHGPVTGQTITVTGNWGTATDNPAIATAKGWTVTG